MTERLFGGRYVAASSFVATADPNYDENLRPWPYDPARSRAILAEAGWMPGPDGVMRRADGTRPSLDLLAGAGAATAGLVRQVIQSELRQVGIEVVAKTEPFRVLDGTTLRRRLFQGMVVEWDGKAPGAFPVTRFGSASIPRESNAWSGWNVTGYSNPRVDTLMKDGLAELDPAKRQATWNELQEIVMDDLPQIPLYQEAFIYVSPTWMTGLTPPRSVYQPTLWIEYWRPRQNQDRAGRPTSRLATRSGTSAPSNPRMPRRPTAARSRCGGLRRRRTVGGPASRRGATTAGAARSTRAPRWSRRRPPRSRRRR